MGVWCFSAPLQNAVVVDLDVVAQRRFELGCGAIAGLIDDVADAAIEALHHARWFADDEAKYGGARCRIACKRRRIHACRWVFDCLRHPSSCW